MGVVKFVFLEIDGIRELAKRDIYKPLDTDEFGSN